VTLPTRDGWRRETDRGSCWAVCCRGRRSRDRATVSPAAGSWAMFRSAAAGGSTPAYRPSTLGHPQGSQGQSAGGHPGAVEHAPTCTGDTAGAAPGLGRSQVRPYAAP
jgi:hypothetical protein